MGRSSESRLDRGAAAEFLREASIHLGISQERLKTGVSASQSLSKDELEVVVALLELVRTGASMKRRTALSRGLVTAIRTVQEAEHDPLAEVDEPMDAREAITEVALAETEAQTHREALLKDCISAAAAATLTGRSRQSIERLRRDHRLMALRLGNQWLYPRWQFEPDAPGGVLPGLEDVLRHLHLSSAGAAFWLLQPSERLGGAPPVQYLRRHLPEPVIQLAREHSLMP
jgi:hypothetical protein